MEIVGIEKITHKKENRKLAKLEVQRHSPIHRVCGAC